MLGRPNLWRFCGGVCCREGYLGIGWTLDLAHILIVGLKETDSSPVLPTDTAADSTGWGSGSTKAKVGGSSNVNTYSGSHQAADLRVGEVPLLS